MNNKLHRESNEIDERDKNAQKNRREKQKR